MLERMNNRNCNANKSYCKRIDNRQLYSNAKNG